MRVLAVSDVVDESLYSSNLRERFERVDMVIGCGDLPYAYLEYLSTLLNAPLYYVPGNHDPYQPPPLPFEGQRCGGNIDGCVTWTGNLLLAGLGGSLRYKPTGCNQYTQIEMFQRLRRLSLQLAWNRWIRRRPLDIFVAHSPPFRVHDDDDLPHTGFRAFNYLIRFFRPRYFLHGHVIFYRANITSPVTQVGRTQVINVYSYRLIDVEVL